MTKMLLLALSLLASAIWLQAQSQYPQTSPNQSASGRTTVEGCLQGSGGNYTLTDNSGTTYELEGDTSKLSEHVGHEVRITGSTTSRSSSSSATTGTTAAGTQQPTLTVQSLKHISKTCKSASTK